MSTPISDVFDGARFNLKGNVSNVRSRTYGDGDMMLFDVEDSTATIPAIVWADAYNVWNGVIKEGNTYMFMNMQVKANPRNNGRVEMKLFKDSKVEICTKMSIARTYGTIASAKSSGSKNAVYVNAIVADVGEDGQKTKNGDPMRRITLIDTSDEVSGFLIGDCALDTIADGTEVNVSGNISSNGNIFVNSITPVDAPKQTLADLWVSTQSSRPPKKPRVESTVFDMNSVNSATPGETGNFVAVVRTVSVAPIQMSSSRVKYTVRVVDKSMACVELGIFLSKEDSSPAFEIGDVIEFKATVSQYNTRSLTTSVVPTKKDDPDLRAWWNEHGEKATFTEVSVRMPRNDAA